MEFTKDIKFNSNPTVNENLTITYSGFLKDSQELYLVYGYSDSWENTSEIKMKKIDNEFVGTVNLQNYDTFNFCFKNSNNNWDNNSYCNYITEITPQIRPTTNFDIDSLIEELLFEPIINIEENVEEESIFEPVVNSENSLYENLFFDSNVTNQSSQNNEIISKSKNNLDLAFQLSTLLSEAPDTEVEFEEFSTLDEILTAQKIEKNVSDELIQDINSNINLFDDYNNAFDNFINIIEFNSNQTQSLVNDISQINNIEEYNEVLDNFINNIDYTYNTSQINKTSLNQFDTYIKDKKENSIVEENSTILDDFLNNLSEITQTDEEKISNINTSETESSFNTTTSLVTKSDSYIVSSRKLGAFYLFRKRLKLALYKVFVKLPKILFGFENE